MKIHDTYAARNSLTLLQGDCLKKLDSIPSKSVDLIITSPPYNIGKEYEKNSALSLEAYLEWLDEVISKLVKKLSETGSICWQTGNHIADAEIFPLDILSYPLFQKHGLRLRNRIIWQFDFGLHSQKRLSGRYETLLWFTKDNYKFNLDSIRVPQKYPGKRHSASRKKDAGKPSGNPLGKNPSDYWEFTAPEIFQQDLVWKVPNVKANHPEKTAHPCQFPVELVERCILAFTDSGDRVLDPFLGTGTTLIAAHKNKRKAVGIEKEPQYCILAKDRLNALASGEIKLREIGKPIYTPKKDKVATIPSEWSNVRSYGKNS